MLIFTLNFALLALFLLGLLIHHFGYSSHLGCSHPEIQVANVVVFGIASSRSTSAAYSFSQLLIS